MARADLLKKLFRGFQNGDREAFLEAARAIVEDERKKSHEILANDLLRILNSDNPRSISLKKFDPVPKDTDRGTSLMEIRQPDRFFRDLILTDQQRISIESVINEFLRWDVLEANGLLPNHKILFCGPPGCGKTATAEAVATELGLPLLYVRFDSVVSSLLGETAANLRKVFEFASRGSWVILFDEFDAIGRSRDDSSEHGELKRVVNSFLQLMDQFQGKSVIIAATNFEQVLDPALWRRFDEIVRFDKPTDTQIEELLKNKLSILSSKKFSFKFASEKLKGMSHAEVERVSLDILKNAVLNGQRVLDTNSVESAISKQEMRKQAFEKSQTSGRPSVDKGL